MKKIKLSVIILFSCLILFGLAGTAAAFTPDFRVNGQWASSFSNGETIVGLGDKITLEYGWWNQLTDDATWYIKYDGLDSWQKLDDDYYPPDQRIYIAGPHQIKCEVRRWQFFRWIHGERTVKLQHQVNQDVAHATKYPIFLVPGVNGFSAVNLLDTVLKTDWNLDEFDLAYFYGVARNLRKDHNQHVIDVSLSAWKETVSRGNDLALQIMQHLHAYDPCYLAGGGKMKANIIAHSHGSTTSRVAVAELANAFKNAPSWGGNSSTGSRIASLTTVAGPHFGTPSPEGGFKFREMLNAHGEYGNEGELVWGRARRFFQSMGVWLAVLSDHKEHIGEGKDGFDIYNWEALLNTQEFDQVAKDFSQPYMYRFNNDTYPCAGLPPGGQYVLSAADIEWLKNQGVTVKPDDLVDESKLAPGENKYNRAYGYGAAFEPGLLEKGICGDGLGTKIDCGCDNAVRYYSFSGHAPYMTAVDPFDLFLLIFNSFHPVAGQDWEDLPVCYQDMRLAGLDGINNILEDAFYLNPSMDSLMDVMLSAVFLGEMGCLSTCMEGPAGAGADHPDMLDNADITPTGLKYRDGIGYTRATDSFIPVDSANFGQYLGTYYWNHADQQNLLLGWIDSEAADPIKVYQNHAAMLSDAGF